MANRPVSEIRVKSCHIDKILDLQVRPSRHRFWLQVGWVLAKTLELAGGIRTQESQISRTDIDTFGLQCVNRMGLVNDVLQRHPIGYKFVINDGHFLISRIIWPQVSDKGLPCCKIIIWLAK